MTRLEKLEAVAEAAREWAEWEADQPGNDNPRYGYWSAVDDALAALDAAGETVTLGLMRGRLSGRWTASEEPEQEDPRDWLHVANITFSAPPLPTVPTITATVTLPLDRERGA